MGRRTSNSTRQIPIHSTSDSKKLECQLKNRLRSRAGVSTTLPSTTRMGIASSSTVHTTLNPLLAIRQLRVEDHHTSASCQWETRKPSPNRAQIGFITAPKLATQRGLLDECHKEMNHQPYQ